MSEPFCWYGIFHGVFIPDFVLSYRGISPGAKLCFARLTRYAGEDTTECWPSQEKLAENLGVSVRTVSSYLVELEADGFIEIKQRGLQQSNKYVTMRHSLINKILSGTASDQDRKDVADPDRKYPSDQDPQDVSGQDRKDPADPTYRTEESHIEENQTNIFTDHKTFIRLWNGTRGLKRLGQGDRSKVQESFGDIQISEEALAAGLVQLSAWLSTADTVRNPVALFLKDPHRWIPTDKPKITPDLKKPVGDIQIPSPVADPRDALKDFIKTCDPRFRHYIGVFLVAGKELTLPVVRAAFTRWGELSDFEREGSISHAERNFPTWKFIPAPLGHMEKQPWTAVQIQRMMPSVGASGMLTEKHLETRRLAREKYGDQVSLTGER